MSVHKYETTNTTYRTVNVASPETVISRESVSTMPRTVISRESVSTLPRTVISRESVSTLPRTVISRESVSPIPYAVNGSSYETIRYLVPVQQQQQQFVPVQQQQFVPVQQQQQFMLVQQPMVQQQVVQQQMVSPVYLHGLPHLSVSSHDSTDLTYRTQENISSRKSSSVFSHSSSPIKSAEEEEEEEEEEEQEEEVELEETEIVNIVQQRTLPVLEKTSRTEVTEVKEVKEVKLDSTPRLDTRYFGELLADVYRKNCDIHSCISQHVSKIRGTKHQLDPSNDYKVEREEVEALLPKGATELTKQQIRYLLQTRLTADKSMRLLLSTFSSLREELLHMSEDLRRLELEKESLERDLSFKADQASQYDSLLEAVRENNRQLQASLKETSSAQRSLESQLLSSRSSDSSRDFRLKEVEGRMKALEQENELLRQKLRGQGSTSSLQTRMEELSRQYQEQLSSLRKEKDQEIQRMRTQITSVTSVSAERSSSEKSLQLKISELLNLLEERQRTISSQEEEIRKLMLQKNESSTNQVTKTIITKRYRNQYPILGLLSDDYNITSPIKEDKTIVIERGEMIKKE